MLSNFRLLCFVNLNKIDEYFNIINNKYKNDFPAFVKY